jgi:hypothetical protein
MWISIVGRRVIPHPMTHTACARILSRIVSQERVPAATELISPENRFRSTRRRISDEQFF